MAGIGAALRGAQAELANLLSHCNGVRGPLNTLLGAPSGAAACEVKEIGIPRAVEVARDDLSCGATMARGQANLQRVDLITLCTEADAWLGTLSLGCSSIQCAGNSPLRTFRPLCMKPVVPIWFPLWR